MAYHPRATPNFRNLVVRPMWTTLRAALRTVPVIGPRFFSTGYHSKEAQMLDEETQKRIGAAHSDGIQFAADRGAARTHARTRTVPPLSLQASTLRSTRSTQIMLY